MKKIRYVKPILQNGIWGFKILPAWLKKKYFEAANYNCQEPNCPETKNLQCHRMTRGNKGGLYTVVPFNHKLNNIQVLCKKHHKARHAGEIGCLRK